MVEKSIYERSGDKDRLSGSGVALGQIVAVDVPARLCSVRTFSGESNLCDKYIKKCQWLSTDANPEGDESTCIPREGSIGLVFFVAGQPFIWGYMKPLNRISGAVTGKESANLISGDKTISTVGGNRVTIKANGVIEIMSSELLKTTYFPKGGLLTDVCEAYQFLSDAGQTKGGTIDELNNAYTLQEWRRDLGRIQPLYTEEKGYVDESICRRVSFGIPLPGEELITTPLYLYEQDITGQIVEQIGLDGTGINIKMTPLGEYTLKSPFSQLDLSAVGDWEFTNPLVTFGMKANGEMSIANATSVFSISPEGDIELSNPTVTLTASATGDISLTNPVITMTWDKAGDFELTNPVCGLKMGKSGDMEWAGPVGKIKIDKAGKIGIGGPTAELLDLFDQFLDAFIKQPSLCLTGVGASAPLSPPAMGILTKIKALLATIKGSV